MASSLSNLVDNLTEGIYKIKWKDWGYFLEYKRLEGNLIIYECLSWNEFYSKNLNAKIKKEIPFNTFKFSNNDINKFILLFRKGVYSYEYMSGWKKFNDTTLPYKEEFYSSLNLEDFTDVDHMHAKRFCKVFEIKYLGEYHDLYLKSDLLLLANVFQNFRKMCLKNVIRSCKIYFISWISMTSSFEKDRNKIRTIKWLKKELKMKHVM